jgi:hypothetical protein
MGEGAASVLVDFEGNEVTIEDGTSIPSGTSGLLAAGKDNSDTARFLNVDGYGSPIIVGKGPDSSVPISGTVIGTITTGSITGTVQANQGLPVNQANRWPVGISNGSSFLGTQANPVIMADDYANGEVLATQIGANAVITFNFSFPVNYLTVESDGYGLVARADPFGGTPSSTLGVPCRHQTPQSFKIITDVVRVYAPTSANITVWGFRR